MDWFEANDIKLGCPENVVHSFSCKQRESLKVEENSISISLTGSAILLRRSKRGLKEDPIAIEL